MSDEKDFEDFEADDIEGEALIGEEEDLENIDGEEDEVELIENKRETRFDIVNLEKTYENYYTQKK
jgi:hypothetical protein